MTVSIWSLPARVWAPVYEDERAGVQRSGENAREERSARVGGEQVAWMSMWKFLAGLEESEWKGSRGMFTALLPERREEDEDDDDCHGWMGDGRMEERGDGVYKRGEGTSREGETNAKMVRSSAAWFQSRHASSHFPHFTRGFSGAKWGISLTAAGRVRFHFITTCSHLSHSLHIDTPLTHEARKKQERNKQINKHDVVVFPRRSLPSRLVSSRRFALGHHILSLFLRHYLPLHSLVRLRSRRSPSAHSSIRSPRCSSPRANPT